MTDWVHIILVGASIVLNAHKKGIVGLELPKLEEALVERMENKERLLPKLVDFVSRDPRNASAELNTCLDLMLDGYQRGRRQWVHLLFSDTEIGELCASVLRTYLSTFSREKLDGRMAILEPIKVEHLGNPDKFIDGLGNLFKVIVDIIKHHKNQGDIVFIHATGGFKPETAIAIMAANSPGAGAPVFYVHEHFRKVVRIPAMPVRFRRWKGFSDLMSHLLATGSANRRALEETFGREVVDEAIRLGWADEKEGRICLTEMGKLLWKYF